MKKKLKDLTRYDIVKTCKKYSKDFTSCDINCPLYVKGSSYKCKSNWNYAKRHREEEVEVEE